jgi:putative redox protein
MKITLKRINEPYHFEAFGENGKSVHIDASPAIGGTDAGVRPMELLLQGLAGCASIDVISILRKQRQQVNDFFVEVDGERETGKDASVFRKIHVHFMVNGPVEENHLQRAIALSMEKYCSVAKTLEKTAEITSSYKLN